MYEIETAIEIHAEAQAVWEVLTDFERYAEWNPFITRVSGDFRVGGRLRAVLNQKDSKPITIKPTLLTLEEGRRFGWRGRLLVPHVMDAEHWFEIEPMAPGRVRFKHWERFDGVLVPLLKGMFDRKTKPSFELMNEALKARVERGG